MYFNDDEDDYGYPDVKPDKKNNDTEEEEEEEDEDG